MRSHDVGVRCLTSPERRSVELGSPRASGRSPGQQQVHPAVLAAVRAQRGRAPLAACIVLIVEPANGRVYALAGGLAIMLAANLILMRRAFGPLRRLTELMERIDPLEPGRPPPAAGARSRR